MASNGSRSSNRSAEGPSGPAAAARIRGQGIVEGRHVFNRFNAASRCSGREEPALAGAQDCVACACCALATAAAYCAGQLALAAGRGVGMEHPACTGLVDLGRRGLEVGGRLLEVVLAATIAIVRFIKVLMTFFVIRLCMRRLTFCRMRLPAEGEFGIAPVDRNAWQS